VTQVENNAVAWLRSPQAIRARCGDLFALVERGESDHFTLDMTALEAAASFVAEIIRENYPDLKVPPHSRWGHFTVGGVDRWGDLATHGSDLAPDERARARIDLAVTSVLLDAGAGATWRFREPGAGAEFTRSEGLAVASFHLFASGALSADANDPLRADAAALKRFDEAALATAFQITADNPMAGAAGRAGLLRALGAALSAAPDLFGGTAPRIGNLYDYLSGRARDGVLPASEILAALLRGLAPIWPGRVILNGENLGDVWRHPAIHADDETNGLVPFHKLPQWLAYSLIEPLEEAGLKISGLDALTGLAEYRNGGLFVDLGVIRPRAASTGSDPLDVGSQQVVEWRALTVVLLDRIADPVRAVLELDAQALPLAAVLEGGTWRAGRVIAAKLRPGGPPPLNVISDGTVF